MSFSRCANLDKIKREIEKFLPDWYYNYILNNTSPNGFINISSRDESDLYFILKINIKTDIDFHLFYRWIGLDSEWAVNAPYKGLSPSIFWMEYYKDHKALQIIIKLVRDYQKIYDSKCSKRD